MKSLLKLPTTDNMSKFTEWFKNKLEVGGFPVNIEQFFKPKNYKYIINMSDEFYYYIYSALLQNDCHTFWFPMNEKRRDIGLNSIYGAMVILYNAEKENAAVYLHCHSGRNRSQLVKACYYYMRTGEQLHQGNEKYINRLHRASTRGYLPPMAEMEAFLRNIGNKIILNKEMRGGILDECKIGTINNF